MSRNVEVQSKHHPSPTDLKISRKTPHRPGNLLVDSRAALIDSTLCNTAPRHLSPPLTFGQVQKTVTSAARVDSAASSHRSVIAQRMQYNPSCTRESENPARVHTSPSLRASRWRARGRALPPVRTGIGLLTPPVRHIATFQRAVSSIYSHATGSASRASFSPCSAIELTAGKQRHTATPILETGCKHDATRRRDWVGSQGRSHLTTKPATLCDAAQQRRSSQGWWDLITSPFVAQDNRFPRAMLGASLVTTGRVLDTTASAEQPSQAIDSASCPAQVQQHHDADDYIIGNPFVSPKHTRTEHMFSSLNAEASPSTAIHALTTHIGLTQHTKARARTHPRTRPILRIQIPPSLGDPITQLKPHEIRRKPVPESSKTDSPATPKRALRHPSRTSHSRATDDPPAYAGVAAVDFFDYLRSLEAGAAPSRTDAMARTTPLAASSRYVLHRPPPPAPGARVLERQKDLRARRRGESCWRRHYLLVFVVGGLGSVCVLCVLLAMVVTRDRGVRAG